MSDDYSEIKPQILIVDDSKVIRYGATKVLSKTYQVQEASDGEEAWEILQQDHDIGMIFCDLQMPRMDGNRLLELIRTSDDPRLINIPVVIITGQEDSDDARELILDKGATDFISKPFDSVALRSRAAAYIDYHQKLSDLGGQVEQDKLTGMSSKQYFYQHGAKDLALARRHETNLTIGLIELDQFPALVEKFGKNISAQILKKISERIMRNLRTEDIAARTDTAQFALILPLTNRIGGRLAIQRVCQDIASLHLKAGDNAIGISISTGITGPEEEPELDFPELMQKAEKALKKAAEAGGNHIVSGADGTPQLLSEPIVVAPRPPEPAPETKEAAQPETPDFTTTISKIVAGQFEDMQKAALLAFLRQLWPFLKQADKRLDLGLQDKLLETEKKLKDMKQDA